jgi:hypothetical protein
LASPPEAQTLRFGVALEYAPPSPARSSPLVVSALPVIEYREPK